MARRRYLRTWVSDGICSSLYMSITLLPSYGLYQQGGITQNSLYVFLKEQGIDYKNYISKRLLPDDAIYVIKDNTVYIIEVKFQIVAGSVDEKLQTCDFKKKQYQKLFSSLNYEVEYIYILSDWFNVPSYKDVLTYINSVGCHYYFKYLPLQKLGLPVPKLRK